MSGRNLRATVVELVDRLIPKRMLRLLVHPKFHKFVGLDRIESVSIWIDNNFMLKRRQSRCQTQPTPADTTDYLKTRFCANPFRQLETAQTGLAYVCCPVWLPTPIGTLEMDPTALWSSEDAKKIRDSIVDGSFRFCSHIHCPSISGRTLPSRESVEAKKHIERHKSGASTLPEHLILSHDKSCNLSCPSCRTSLYGANSKKQAKLDALTEHTLVPLMKGAKSVLITGSGDPFGSKHFRNLIKRLNNGEFPDLRIDLISNGQLWDMRAWNDLRLNGRVQSAEVSIDATTSETYQFVRRGGNFDRLLDNLAFIRDLRQSGEIAHFAVSMVVQARNFREMVDFVRLGERFSADRIIFNMIRQRDIFGREEFVEAFVGDPAHPEYGSFCRALAAPELAQRNVQIGNVKEYVRRAEQGQLHAPLTPS